MSDEYFAVTPDAGLAVGNAAPVWELSGWWRRVGAQVIDSLLIWVPLMILVSVSGIGGDTDASENGVYTNLDGVGVLAFLILSASYYMWTMSAWNGQTVGKKVTGIRVVREDGLDVDAKFAFTRQTLVIGLLFGFLAAFLIFIPTVLNYLWPLWDEKHQALHDKIVNSRVVREQPSTDPGTFQMVQQQQAPFPVAPPAPEAAPPPPVPPASQAPPAPPTPGGSSTPYTPPVGFENPVPDDE